MTRYPCFSRLDIAREVCQLTGIPQQTCRLIVAKVINTIIDGLFRDGQVMIMGFGTFYVGECANQYFRKPYVYFAPAKALKLMVNNPNIAVPTTYVVRAE